MFSDVPGFQDIVPHCKPTAVVHLLNELFTKFDRLVTLHGVKFYNICRALKIKQFSGLQSRNRE